MSTRAIFCVAVLASFDAHADEQGPITNVTSSFPASETTLPLNGRVAFFGNDIADISFVRVFGDGITEEELAFEKVPEDAAAAYFVTLGELVPGEVVTIAVRCDSCGFVGTWTVVDSLDAEAPVFDDGPTDVLVTARYGSFSPFVNGYEPPCRCRAPATRSSSRPPRTAPATTSPPGSKQRASPWPSPGRPRARSA